MSKMIQLHQAKRSAADLPKIAATPEADQGRFVNLVQTDKNTLLLIPDVESIKEFIEDNYDHFGTDLLDILDPTGEKGLQASAESPRHNVWGDHTLLHELLEDFFGNGWDDVQAHEIGALTDAPILRAPDGRIYWHERYQIESAADELIQGKQVKFDGAPENKQSKNDEEDGGLEPDGDAEMPGPDTKTSAKTADVDGAPAPSDVSTAPPAAVPPVAAASGGNPYQDWQTGNLIETIESLTDSDSFASDKPEQKAVEMMAEVLSARPVEAEPVDAKKTSSTLRKAAAFYAKAAGTWMDDIKKSDPELAAAYAITGNQPTWALKNMIKALEMMGGFMNSEEDTKRLEAAKFILKKQRGRKASEGETEKQAALTSMDKFTAAYIEAALWSSSDNSDVPLDQNYSASDLAPVTMQAVQADCAKFQAEAGDMIADDLIEAGHDFWLTREGHGAGFWDGDWPENGEALDELSKKFGEFPLYIGDDGMIYASGHETGKAASVGSGFATNDETSAVLEGDTSVPDGRDKVEDNTGIVFPKTDNPSKFAADGPPPCSRHKGHYVMGCSECERYGGYVPPKEPSKRKDKKADANTGIVFPKTDNPSKFAAETWGTSHFVDFRSAVTYYADYGNTPEDVKEKVEAGEIHIGKPDLKAGESLKVNRTEGRYFIQKKAVRDVEHEQISASTDEQLLARKNEILARATVLNGVKSYNNDDRRELQRINSELLCRKDGTPSQPHVTRVGRATKQADGNAVMTNDGSLDVLEGDTSVADNGTGEEDNTGLDIPTEDSPSKFAAAITTSKALKLVEDIAEKLQALYMGAKPITQANDSRPVREAVESIYHAMKALGEAQKVLAKQERQEAEDAAALELKAKPKKSSLMASLKLAEAEPDEPEEGDDAQAKEASFSTFAHLVANKATKVGAATASASSGLLVRHAKQYTTAQRMSMSTTAENKNFYLRQAKKQASNIERIANRIGVKASFDAKTHEVKVAFEDGSEAKVPSV